MSREPRKGDTPPRIVGIVYGFCPQGCGQTLQVDGIGTVSCYAPSCPQPDSVHLLLQDPETEHLVVVGEFGYTIQHPLRERVHGELFEWRGCPWARHEGRSAVSLEEEVSHGGGQDGQHEVRRLEGHPVGGHNEDQQAGHAGSGGDERADDGDGCGQPVGTGGW